MSDRQATNTTPTVADRPSDRAGVDVATAARHLGISHDAVRGRLRRKSLAGDLQPNGQWIVYLDTELDDSVPTGEQQATTGHRQATNSHTTALIEALQAQVSDLQRRLDRQDVHLQSIIAKLPNPDLAIPATLDATERAVPPAWEGLLSSDNPQMQQIIRLERWTRGLSVAAATLIAATFVSSYLGSALTSSGRFFSWENLGKTAIIATVLAIPLAIIGIVVTVWIARRSPPPAT